MSSRGNEWDRVRSLEDLLALVARIDDRRRVVRAHAWHQGSFEAIFDEVTAMRVELQQLGSALGSLWRDLYANAQGGE